MNPFDPPKIQTAETRVCVLCGQSIQRTFSPFQRVQCVGCGCLLALKLSTRWQFIHAFALMTGCAGLVWLPTGMVQKTLLFVGMTALFFSAFGYITSVAGQLWPVRNGLFVSKRSLDIARDRYQSHRSGGSDTSTF
jgi:uncharacterized paraquat-inducible protein A